MHYTLCDYAIFFFVYSVMGWMIEEIFAAFKYGRFINRGVLNGPICPIYGISMLVIINNLQDLAAYPWFQLVAAVIAITVTEYIAGVFLYKFTGKRLWDYSKKKWNFNGYICLQYSLIWGICAVGVFWLIHPFIYMGSQLLPDLLKYILLIGAALVFFLDVLITSAAVFKWKKQAGKDVVERFEKVKNKLGEKLIVKIQRRLYRSFPGLVESELTIEEYAKNTEQKVFAQGMCLDKFIWVFLVSGFVGDLIETAFMWITTGELTSRSSLIYGAFSVVWGLGGAAASALLYSLRDKGIVKIFIAGFFLGGVYEYTCSVFTEVFLGSVFWDYSKLPFNLNGRVNLLFCVFWGIAAIGWIKILYPLISKPIEKIPMITGKIVTWFLIVIMVFDMAVSGLAIRRHVDRQGEKETTNTVEEFFDYSYPDSLMELIYPYMRITE